MQIIVSDTSCLIDLRKASFLEAFLKLSFDIVIPDTLFEEELVRFSPEEKAILLAGGLKVLELPGEGVLRAQSLEQQFPALSIHDCFAFSLAERHPGCILLTGDNLLRTVAIGHDIEVHGVLWVITEIHKAGIAAPEEIITVLEFFENDPAVFLPRKDVRALIKYFKAMIDG